MKERNIEGSSKGYVDRVVSSYTAVTEIDVRKYFLSTLKFCKLYEQGETGYTVNKQMQELRKVRRCHRGAIEFEVDHTKKLYSRQRF